MCGITGALSFNRSSVVPPASFYSAHALLRHRGPDDEGFLGVDFENNLTHFSGGDTVPAFKTHPDLRKHTQPLSLIFGHHRLSIIDLSDKGHQPMGDETQDVWVIFNGEIYNHIELRKELEAGGAVFKSQSDTEVLIHAYKKWGENLCEKLNGMWAFALLDRKKKRILFSRDRAGMKPLYYVHDKDRFLFASELRFLKKLLPPFSLNQKAAAQYLQLGYLDGSQETFYTNVSQLNSGEIMLLDYENNRVTKKTYWSPSRVISHVSKEDILGALENSLRLHLRSDVPLGVSLSGGVDSTALTCLIASKGEKLSTFSVRYKERQYSEEESVKETLKKVNSEHTWVEPDLAVSPDQIEKLLAIQEVPVRSLAVLMQLQLMAQVKKSGVTVILGGQGADEMFGGYSYYSSYAAASYMKRLKLFSLLNELKASPESSFGATLKIFIKTFFKGDPLKSILVDDFQHRCLPEYLHYEDRNSMAHSVESRLPFLEKNLLELAFSLRNEDRIKDGQKKVILRSALEGIIPESIRTDRVKRGFVVPQPEWQKGQLKPLLDGVFNSDIASLVPFLTKRDVQTFYEDYKAGRHDDWGRVWRLACFKMWHNHAF